MALIDIQRARLINQRRDLQVQLDAIADMEAKKKELDACIKALDKTIKELTPAEPKAKTPKAKEPKVILVDDKEKPAIK